MERKHRLGYSWLAVVLCMALLMTGLPFAPAYAKSKKDKYYTIKWKVNGETVKKEKVKKGEIPEAPEDPGEITKDGVTYVFQGWEPKVTKAKENVTYKAKFKKKASKTVTITWLDDEGALIDFTQVKVGKMPKHEDPKKKASKKYTYVFDGWEPKLEKATEDTTYTATFQKKARKYKITWLDDKGNVIDETKVAYGKLPEHDDPVKKSKKYNYTFTGWQPAITEVTGEATYTATFEKGEAKGEADAETYTITWLDDEGNLIDTTTVKAGKKPKHDAPTKAPTDECDYQFAGWEPEVVKATADATYTATFEKVPRKFTITWLDDEGNVVDQTRVSYGEVPTHDALSLPDSETHSYVFRGWDPEPVAATGDATYTAVFDEVAKEGGQPQEGEQTEATGETATYSISWLNEAGELIEITTVQAGEMPYHDAPEKPSTEQYSYTFAGWSPEPVPAEGDAAYIAAYTETLRSYAVTWQDDTGAPIDTTLVPYGDMPVHDDPVKEPVEGIEYTFAGWTPELAPVTGEATYTATFTEGLPIEVDDPALAVGDPAKITVQWGHEKEDTVLEGNVGDPVTAPEAPTVDGYVFDHWMDTADQPIPFPETFPDVAETVIKAAWVQGATITFKYGYDTTDAPVVLTGKVDTEVDKTKAPTYARDGYTFAGWNPAIPDKFSATAGENVDVTALWLKIDPIGDVTINAYKPEFADLVEKKLPAAIKVTLGDGTTVIENAPITWNKGEYGDAASLLSAPGDGEYVFTGTVTAQDASGNTYSGSVTCKLIIEPKTYSDDSGKYEYHYNGLGDDAKAVITKWEGTEVKEEVPQPLTITSIVKDGDKTVAVAGIGENVFNGKLLSMITVPAGVQTIGNTAFANMPNLTSLTLPDSLDALGTDIIAGSAALANKILSVGSTSVFASGYTICHVPVAGEEQYTDATTGLTRPVTLPAGMPTDIVGAGGRMKLDCAYVPTEGHSVTGDVYAIISWQDENGAPLSTSEVNYGVVPVNNLTKESTAQYDYTFNGWESTVGEKTDPVPVTGPATYKSKGFTSTLRQYTITFVDEDGKTNIEDPKKWEYGAVPTCDTTPTKKGYTFSAWLDTGDNDKEYKVGVDLPNVTGDRTYKAKYEQLYTITFVDEDGKTVIEKTETYKYNDVPKCSKTPTKEGYTFTAWLDTGDKDKEYKVGVDLPNVTSDRTYKAKYEETPRTNVPLTVTYSGPALTKTYDLTRNAFQRTSSGKYTYLVTAPKAADFSVAPKNKSDETFFNNHKDVKVKVTSIKSVEQFSDSKVGDYTLKFTFGLDGTDARYYIAESVSVPAKIEKREVKITPRAGLSKVYGTKDPAYPDNSWLSRDTSSPLNQNISGQPGYAVPVNTQGSTLTLSLDDGSKTNPPVLYLLEEAKKNGTKFFPNDGFLSRESGEDVGKYKITIGKMDFGSNFKMTLNSEVFTITAKDITPPKEGTDNITVDAIADQTYTGKEITPEVTVRYGTMTLKKDTDYTVKYDNNTEVGTAKVTLTGKGNFTGTRETTFAIKKTSDSGGGSSGGGSSSSGYGYDGFDDEDESAIANEEEADGVLKLGDLEIGTILFGADGKPRPFVKFEEELEPEEVEEDTLETEDDLTENTANEAAIEIEDMPEENPPRRLTIVPEPMKEQVPVVGEDGETGETEEQPVLIEGTQRQQYEELHLRLTTSEVQALVNNNVKEIVYELEQAQMHIPLSALTNAIPLPSEEDDEGEIVELDDGEEEDFEVEEEIEIEGEDELPEAEEATGPEEIDTPVETQDAVQTMAVEGYDIVIEQADATGLSQRETALIADYQTLLPAYRVRISVIPEGAEQQPTGENDAEGQPITIPVMEALPEGYTLPDVALKLVPNESFVTAPLEAQVLYATAELEAEDESAEATETAAVPADPIAEGEATLTPAEFDEEDDPIKAVVNPVIDGMYTVVAPIDWDPTPYLTDAGETTAEDDTEIGEEIEVDDEEVEIVGDEDEEIVEF